MKNIIITVIAMLLSIGCSSQNITSASDNGKQKRRGAPDFTQLLEELDSNKDGKLSKSEVKGPILEDFAKIDSDEDGFISKEELEKAPKPQRGQRPPKNN